MIRKLLLLSVLLFGCALHAQVASDLDATFNHADHMDLTHGSLRKMMLLPSGKILVMNQNQNERFIYGVNIGPKLNLFRLNADLTFDETFTPIALLMTTFAGSYDFDVFSNNKLLVAGEFKDANDVAYDLARFNEDGTPDTGFSFTNTQGFTQFNVNSVRSVKILQNDQVIIGGLFTLTRFSFQARSIAKINYDGTVDMTFVASVISQNNGVVEDIDTDTAGNVIAVGSYNNGASFPSYDFVKKRSPSGAAVAGFTITETPSEYLGILGEDLLMKKVKVTAENKIYAWLNHHTIKRLLPDGSTDTGFTPIEKARDFEIMSNGNILVSNYETKTLQIYDSQGLLLMQNTLDENAAPFICIEGTNGAVVTQVRTTNSLSNDMQPLRIVQYTANLTLDTSLDKTGYFKSYKVLKTEQDNLLILGHRKDYGLMKHHNGVKYVDYAGDLMLNSPFSQWSNAGLSQPFSDLNYYDDGLVLPDGKIWLSFKYRSGSGQLIGQMVRLNPDFSTDLVINTNSAEKLVMAHDPISNRLFLGGSGLLMYESDGTFDSNFWNESNQTIHGVNDIEILPGGKIMVADDNGVRVILPTGTIDATYPGGLYGFVVIEALQPLPTGQTIIAGAKMNVGARARLNADGTLDATYGATPLPATVKKIRSLKTFTDGSSLAVYDATTTKSELIKFDANGNLESFDTGTGFNGIISSFEIFEDGRIMVAGNFNQYNGTYVNGVARLNGLSGVLGTVALEKDAAAITLFPNPASTSLQIAADETIQKIELFSFDGKLLRATVSPTGPIDVTGLASGYYLTKVYFESGSVVRKFIKN